MAEDPSKNMRLILDPTKGSDRLLWAIKREAVEEVRAILEGGGVDVDQKSPSGGDQGMQATYGNSMDERVDPAAYDNAAIIFASQLGRTDIVGLLLRTKQVDPSVKVNLPLQLAVRQNNLPLAALLLHQGYVDPSLPNQMPLRLTITEGHFDIFHLFLYHPRVHPGHDNNAALQKILMRPHPDDALPFLVQLLQHPELDPSVPNHRPFLLAALKRHPPTVEAFLDHPLTNPTAMDHDVVTKLMETTPEPDDISGYANRMLTYTCLDLILSHPSCTPLRTPVANDLLLWTCGQGHVDLLQRLLDRKHPQRIPLHAQTRLSADMKRHQPLALAVRHNQRAIVAYLLHEQEIDITQPSLTIHLALITATRRRHTHLLAYLLKQPQVRGALPECVTQRGEALLRAAVQLACPPVATRTWFTPDTGPNG